jgi:gluconokinase
VIVMGVAGSGKSSVASGLGGALGLEVIEGDDYHPQSSIDKMAAGIPLTDADRRPWLETLARLVGARHAGGVGTVLACSALRRSYRDILRSTVPNDQSFVIQLDADAETLRERMADRTGHFMPVSLLDSQLATLEPLQPDERGAVIDVTAPLDVVIDRAMAAVRGGQHGTLRAGR